VPRWVGWRHHCRSREQLHAWVSRPRTWCESTSYTAAYSLQVGLHRVEVTFRRRTPALCDVWRPAPYLRVNPTCRV